MNKFFKDNRGQLQLHFLFVPPGGQTQVVVSSVWDELAESLCIQRGPQDLVDQGFVFLHVLADVFIFLLNL